MIQLTSMHLRSLTHFSGREAPKPFWLWVAVVIGVATAAMLAVMIPMMVSFFGNIERFAAEHPDQVTRTVGPNSYSIIVHGHHPELVPDFGGMVWGFAIISAIVIALLAAAVARRLHDRDRTGAWGLPPVVLLLTGLAGMGQLFGQIGNPAELSIGLLFAMFLNNMAYLAALGVLLVLLVGSGTQGENRYGLPPA